MSYLPFGPFQPDKPSRLNDGALSVADGVFPLPDGYRPCGQFAPDFSALPSKPRGGATFVSTTGIATIIVGTSTTLYRAVGSGFDAIGTGYSLQEGMRWRFAQFGDLAIATNGADAPVKINLSDFTVSNLGGSPPKFESIGVVKDFLVGTIRDGAVNVIAWSALNNAESWTVGTGQADYNEFPDGGRVNGILSGEFGVILQRNSIRVMSYVGGNVIFSMDVVSTNIGCISPHTVAQAGRLGFFVDDKGPAMWTGSDVQSIGDEEWSRAFMAGYDVNDWPECSTAVDRNEGVVLWAMPDKIWGYNWRLNRAFTLPYVSPIIFGGVTKGLNIDEMDDAVGPTDDNIDGVGLLPFDDPSFQGGDPRLYVFSDTYALGTFTGTPMAATFRGNDLELVPGRRANVSFVRPDIDCTALTVTLKTKQRLADSYGSSSSTDMRDSGDVPVRSSGRYIQPTFSIAAGTSWTFAKGAEFVVSAGGGR